VATKPKRYDLKAADRKRSLAIQIGLTAIVVIFAVVLVGYIVLSNDKKPQSGETKAVRVASSNVIKKEGSDEPKVVLSMYEDFLCPHCGVFEQQFGPTVRKLISTGAVALFQQQPQEGAGVYPDNARLIEVARQSGAGGKVPDCINSGRYVEMSQGLAAAAGIQATPTVRINGQDYSPTTPDALVAKIKETVGNVPGLDGAAPPEQAPAPPQAPAPAP
jgi:protein-disulfide isomerase